MGNKVVRSICLLLILLGVTGLASCRRTELVFAIDRFWYNSGYFSREMVSKLKTTAARNGAKLDIVVAGEGKSESPNLQDIVAEGKPDILLLSPLLTRQTGEPLTLPQAVRYVGISLDPLEQVNPEHYGIISVSRYAAMRDLGTELCKYLQEKQVPGITGFWYTEGEVGKREYHDFYKAFTADCAAEQISITEIGRADLGTPENFLRDFQPEQGMIGLAFAADQNQTYLEEFRERGLGIAGEYIFLEDFPDTNPLFSIELPLETIVGTAAAKAPGWGEKIEVDAVLIKRK